MTKVMKGIASGLFALTLSVTALAEGKGMQMSGAVEAGYAVTWNAGATNNNFLLDYARMNMEYNASDSVKVVFNNVFSVTNTTQAALAVNHNSGTYFSGARIATAAGGMALTYANQAAYIDFKCSEKIHTWVGHFALPFGMEAMWDRYNMHTYYYSQTYTGMFTTLGWNQDLGIKMVMVDVLPGTFELAIMNDQNALATSSPGIGFRYAFEMKSGDFSLTPIVSGYFGNFAGPTDIGISGGVRLKTGALWANAEFLYGTRGTGAASTNELIGIIAEPGFDLGFADVSAKFEWNKNGANDMNLGFAVSHEYSGGYRVKLAYNHVGLSGNLNPHVNDVRVLFGVKW